MKRTGDHALDELLAAASICVDNWRSGPTCYGKGGYNGHPLGTNPTCDICGLHNATVAVGAIKWRQVEVCP